ncbi:MAG: tRNA pseudouridine(38-40) synthase TruA [Salinivirgaceae bacterium]|jgi:tRNA pseudouridine38-40 synthase|nr:tRNA pseudouridine(38-40) synthase TruA [Bacteroidales bacterium]
MRYFIKIAFCGTNYFGWQKQLDAVTVQEVLSERISKLLRSETDIVGAGRTDTGVHALVYYAHFDTVEKIEDCENMVYRLNKMLPNDIVVYDIFSVDSNAHARYDAISRTYHYYIDTQKNPFTEKFMSYRYQPTDFDLMNEAAMYLLQVSDFSSFCKTGSDNKTTICKVTEAQWHQINSSQYFFRITADRFLRNMVRAIVGTLFDVGEKKISLDEFYSIINKRDRCEAGESVEAKGLFLADVRYPFIKGKDGISINHEPLIFI